MNLQWQNLEKIIIAFPVECDRLFDILTEQRVSQIYDKFTWRLVPLLDWTSFSNLWHKSSKICLTNIRVFLSKLTPHFLLMRLCLPNNFAVQPCFDFFLLCLYMYDCLPVCLSVCLSIYVSVCLSVYLSVRLFVHLSVRLPTWLAVFIPAWILACSLPFLCTVAKCVCLSVWYHLILYPLYNMLYRYFIKVGKGLFFFL